MNTPIPQNDPGDDDYLPLTMEDLINENPRKYNRLEGGLNAYGKRILALRLIHAPAKPYTEARKLFSQMVEKINVGGEGTLLAFYGSSQSGKSHILRRLRRHKLLQPRKTEEGIVRPLIMLEAPSPCTLKALGVVILENLKFPEGRGTSMEELLLEFKSTETHLVWNQVRALLEAQGVCVLVLDEIHNVFVGQGTNEREQTAMTIKALLVSERWPLQVVLSGTTYKTKKFVDDFPELKERVKRVEVKAIPRNKMDDMKLFLESIEGQLDLSEASNLGAGDMPERFWLASRGHRGRVARLIFEAAELAYGAHKSRIDRKILERALHVRTHVAKERNPFYIANPAGAVPLKDVDWEDTDEATLLKGKTAKAA